MHVVPAHVTDRHSVALAIGRRRLARVRQIGAFLDGQRVHVRAQHDHRSIAIPQQTDDSGLPGARITS